MLDKVRDDVNYYKEGALKLLQAKFSEVVLGMVSQEVQNFRKQQCLNCPLFNKFNNTCNRDFLTDGKTLIPMERVYSNELPKIEVDGIIRQTVVDGVVFTRGCGCTLWNSEPQKIKYYFPDNELERKDGAAPCPLNKWTKEEYLKFYDKNGNSENSQS